MELDMEPAKMIERILDPHHPLCRTEVIRVLEYMKKRMVEKDPKLLGLTQPHLLTWFAEYAGIALSLLNNDLYSRMEPDFIRLRLAKTVRLLECLPSECPHETGGPKAEGIGQKEGLN
jgi:hypothetical protein